MQPSLIYFIAFNLLLLLGLVHNTSKSSVHSFEMLIVGATVCINQEYIYISLYLYHVSFNQDNDHKTPKWHARVQVNLQLFISYFCFHLCCPSPFHEPMGPNLRPLNAASPIAQQKLHANSELVPPTPRTHAILTSLKAPWQTCIYTTALSGSTLLQQGCVRRVWECWDRSCLARRTQSKSFYRLCSGWRKRCVSSPTRYVAQSTRNPWSEDGKFPYSKPCVQ